MALPELVSVAYENQEYNPKLQYLTGVARDDASYLLCESRLKSFAQHGTYYSVQSPIRPPVHLELGFYRPTTCTSLFEHETFKL